MKATPTTQAPTDTDWLAVRAALDAELDQLPEKYRVPLILFHMQGLSLAQIAEQMSVTVSTIGTWLGRAREQLAKRLTRRGITIGAALLATGLSRVAQAGVVPAGFVGTTVTAASLYGAGHLSVAGSLSASTSALAGKCLQAASWFTPWKITIIAVSGCGCIGLLAFVALHDSGQSQPPSSGMTTQSSFAPGVPAVVVPGADLKPDEVLAGTPAPMEPETDPNFGGVTGQVVLADPQQPQQILDELQQTLQSLPPPATAEIGSEPLPGEIQIDSPLHSLANPGTDPQSILKGLQEQIGAIDPALVGPPATGIPHAFIYLKEAPNLIPSQRPALPTQRLVVDNVGAVFVPHAFFVRVGQTVVFKNGNPFSIIVHTNPASNLPSNTALMPMNRVGTPEIFSKPESHPCVINDDIHATASCYALILDHPYAAVTDANGRFQIPHLPVGTHKFRVWHQKHGYLQREYPITVTGGQTVSLPPLTVSAESLK